MEKVDTVSRNLQLALAYRRMGISVFPVVDKGKHLISWKPYQDRLPTEDEIKAWWTKHPDANIAIITGMVSGLCVVDMDSIEARKWFEGQMPEGMVVPMAKTPKGWHMYFKCPDASLRNNVNQKLKCDFRANGGIVVAPPSKVSTGQYAWLKDLSIFKVSLVDLPDFYKSYIYNTNNIYNTNSFSKDEGGCTATRKYSLSAGKQTKDDVTLMSQDVTRTEVTSVTDSGMNFAEGSRDNDLFHVANQLVKANMPIHEIEQIMFRLARECDPPFPQAEVARKIQSAINRHGSRATHLTQELTEWVNGQVGTFSTVDAYKELFLSSKSDISNARKILSRLADEGVIERVGKRSGIYRRVVDNFKPVVEFNPDNSKPLDLWLPLDMHQYAKIFPTNMIVVSGEKSTGKTGFCLSFATNNRELNMPIRYISSEFGAEELYERLKFMDGINPNEWIKRIEFNIFRGEPQDAIRKDAINIVDYLEIRDGEYYKVGGYIDKIFDKVGNGIALIALQTNPGKEIARGGYATLDKSRLYVALNKQYVSGSGIKNVATIVDAKHRVNPMINPNWTCCEYKLGGGYYFKRETPWMPK